MNCPDCTKKLVISKIRDYISFQCNFCGLNEQIYSTDEKEAYKILIRKKENIRDSALYVRKIKSEETPLFTRKTDEEKKDLIKKGGYNPENLSNVVKGIINNTDVELIYYKFLKQKSPPSSKQESNFPQPLNQFLEKKNMKFLYDFQNQSSNAIHDGKDVVIVAPTGTGKTEAFLLPILTKIWNKASHPLLRRGLSTIIIYPTKALARDQKKKILEYGRALNITCEIFDGDTPKKIREKIMEYPPDILITNPDMLHFHLRKPQFRDLLRTIESIIIDEIHVAVGAFGTNIYFILKRLQRLVKNKIQLIGSSATIGNAKEFASSLFDREVEIIAISEARKAPTHLLIALPWGVSQYTITSAITRQLITQGHKTLCFQNSHKNAEIVNLLLRRARVKSAIHRAGLTMEYRNKVETEFRNGELSALVSTPTLELGIDIGDVDGVVSSIVDITSFIQRLGRAGRKGQESIGALILRNDDPISTYYISYPETYFEDIRKGYVEPMNEIVSYYQLLSAAIEKPIEKDEFPNHTKIICALENENLLRKTQSKTYRIKSKAEAVQLLRSYSIRGIGDNLSLKDINGKKLGERSMPMAARELHPGAFYLHGGAYYRSQKFTYNPKFGGGEIILKHIEPVNLKTTALRYATPTILSINENKTVFGSDVIYCDLEITENIVGYQISEIYTNKIQEIRDLEEPIIYSFPTKGFVFTMPKPLKLPIKMQKIPEKTLYSGTFHAIEHVLIESSSMLTGGGSNEIGGISMGSSGAIFVYDAAKGGSGLSKLLYDRLDEGLNRSLKILQECNCTSVDGCPRCTYSYQCGNNNQPLSKTGAIESLKLIDKTKSKIIEDFTEYDAYV